MKKKWVSGMLALLLVGTTVGSMMPTEAVQAEENSQGKTYYVDSENGKDTNDGLSEGKAFQTLNKVNDLTLGAGDRVLLKTDRCLRIRRFILKEAEVKTLLLKFLHMGMRKTDVLRSIQTVMDNGN